MASKMKVAGRRGLVLVVAAIVAASFGVSGASAAKPLRGDTNQQILGLWDGP